MVLFLFFLEIPELINTNYAQAKKYAIYEKTQYTLQMAIPTMAMFLAFLEGFFHAWSYCPEHIFASFNLWQAFSNTEMPGIKATKYQYW